MTVARLALHGGTPVVEPGKGSFDWPVISDGIREAVQRQLATTISIRDRSGVLEDFEESFANYHGRRYALTSNSGTSAIMSMFEGIDIGPGDQVIAAAYGFHASVSPAVYLGADVVFADIDDQGGMSAASFASLIGPNTRAVVLTHLWGLPAIESRAIADTCREHGVLLLEDCSHAHGATLDGALTGTFGTAAAWSLQGQKLVSGGEGGILLTDDEALFERAVLQGHYNRRTRDEISRSSPLWPYRETGLGLKLRAHPLAMAIALEQFGRLDEFLRQKNIFAKAILEGLGDYDFLHLPALVGMVPSWYAFPLRYDSSAAGGVTRARFVEALHAEGLSEVDIPGATGILTELPLFRLPKAVLGRRYGFSEPLRQEADAFPTAEKYAAEIVKIPVWAFAHDETVMQAYIEGLRKVADYVAKHRSL